MEKRKQNPQWLKTKRNFKAKKLSTGTHGTAAQKPEREAKAIITEILFFNKHKGSGHVTLVTRELKLSIFYKDWNLEDLNLW